MRKFTGNYLESWIFLTSPDLINSRCGHNHVLMLSLILTPPQEVGVVQLRKMKCLKQWSGQWIVFHKILGLFQT